MNGIDAQPRTVKELLTKRKYGIDEYQREYRWTAKNIEELLNDLSETFLLSYDVSHERYAVENYKNYFLGSIILNRRSGRDYIIDGQQRITSLTLLLIYLHHLQNDLSPEHPTNLEDMIFSNRFGRRSFNLDVPDRVMALEALYTGEPYDSAQADESLRAMLERYHDMEEQFPEELKGSTLPYFIDWLLEKVQVIEIATATEDDAYIIFETMNDRGQPLAPTDMLKGYLLSKIVSSQDRLSANEIWRERISELRELGKEEDADFIKHLLRAKFAQTIRERKKGAENQDFEQIGTTFHRWVRDNRTAVGLTTSTDFDAFIRKLFARYAREYYRIRQASLQLTPGFETLYYNANNNFTLQYPILLAALRPEDDRKTIDQKVRLVATFLDILIARRAVNYYELKYSAMVYSMFLLIHAIRNRTVEELLHILKELLAAMDYDFNGSSVEVWRRGVPEFHLNNWSKRYIHHILARLTVHIETQSGMPNHYEHYINRGPGRPYEIEHVWSNHFEEHTDEFDHPDDFQRVRNKIGGLLLLPRGFNQSFGDLPYEEKREHYLSQNLLARSLHEQCYLHHPTFLHYIKQSGQPFRPHKHFKRADLEIRQDLYRSLCEEIWHPSRLDREMGL